MSGSGGIIESNTEFAKVVTLGLAFFVQLAALFYWGGVISSSVNALSDRLDRHIDRAQDVNDRQDREITEIRVRLGVGEDETTLFFYPPAQVGKVN